MGWNVCLMQTSHTLQRGFGFTTKIRRDPPSPCQSCVPTERPEHVNPRTWQSDTPLHAAAAEGHTDILSLLIEHGADLLIKAREVSNNTPLHRASWNTRLEAGKYPLNRGADIDARNKFNHNALTNATSRGHVEFSRMLLERGAVIDARCQHDQTSLYSTGKKNPGRATITGARRRCQFVRRIWQDPFPVGVTFNYPEIAELLSAYVAESVNE